MPSSRTICGHFVNDDGRRPGGGLGPWYPWGSLDGKAADSACALSSSLWARCGRACGTPVDVEEYLTAQPQYAWLRGWMLDRPPQPWTRFGDGAA